MSKTRRILLIEPNYRNKYPPIGLMKISTYHRMLGDHVEFFKGDLKDLVIKHLLTNCLRDLRRLNSKRDWNQVLPVVRSYIKTKKQSLLDSLIYRNSPNRQKLIAKLNYYSDIYRKKDYDKFPKWERVYVTTLFTFYWKITINTIKFAKNIVKDPQGIFVGGVLASLLHREIELETGIKAHKGLLDKPGLLDPKNRQAADIVIDNLPLDYSILEETDYVYPTGSAYFTFMTKGCTRKCAFCSVPILEPTYKPKIDTLDKFAEIKLIYGEQQHLLLMDNNVLASPNFPEIIDEIKQMGFYKGATYIEPNQLDIAIKNLRDGLNDIAYIKRAQRLYVAIIKRLQGATKVNYIQTLNKFQIDNPKYTTKQNLLRAYKELKDIYEKFRYKQPQMRYVDFNQGTDARYVTDEIMKLISEIPIRPLRIAFDYWGLKDKYEAAVRLAAKYGLKELSNYILYNFNDNPDELYKRLEINILLNEELGTKIFSFPMKYIPLFGEESKDRNYIGRKWNKKFIRSIQSILNVTKGIVAPGKNLFYRAFGRDLTEFHEILYMPEEYIVYRQFFEDNGFTEAWRGIFHSLDDYDKTLVYPVILSNDFKNYESHTTSEKILTLLRHYAVKKQNARKLPLEDMQYRETKRLTYRMIKKDMGINLTLTYDFEAESARKKHSAQVDL